MNAHPGLAENPGQVLTRELRRRALRPHCEACAGVRGRATIEIAHPPGEEIQWDWLELPGVSVVTDGMRPCTELKPWLRPRK